jgi:hypothetical protein
VTVVRHPAARPTLRRLTPAVIPGVRRVFRDTVALGRPLPFPLPGFAAYERLCLGWFLGPGWEDAAVLDEDAQVRGYVLVCTDLPAYRRWAARAAAAWVLATTARLAGGRLPPEAARFYRLRLLDGLQALREGPAPPMPAVVHLNLDPGLRGGMEGLRLARHADRRCAEAGLPGWYGEVNAPVGGRAAGLRRGGFEVVHRAPNHTLSWLAGRPVERLTIVRSLPRAAAAPAPPAPVPPAAREAG